MAQKIPDFSKGPGGLVAIIGDEVSATSHTLRTVHVHMHHESRVADAACYASVLQLSIALFQDTVTGFLLSGVGHRDNKNRVNYLVVDAERKRA